MWFQAMRVAGDADGRPVRQGGRAPLRVPRISRDAALAGTAGQRPRRAVAALRDCARSRRTPSAPGSPRRCRESTRRPGRGRPPRSFRRRRARAAGSRRPSAAARCGRSSARPRGTGRLRDRESGERDHTRITDSAHGRLGDREQRGSEIRGEVRFLRLGGGPARPFHRPVEDGGEELLLAAEPRVERLFRRAGERGDLVHRGGLVALLQEQPQRRFLDIPVEPRRLRARRASATAGGGRGCRHTTSLTAPTGRPLHPAKPGDLAGGSCRDQALRPPSRPHPWVLPTASSLRHLDITPPPRPRRTGRRATDGPVTWRGRPAPTDRSKHSLSSCLGQSTRLACPVPRREAAGRRQA